MDNCCKESESLFNKCFHYNVCCNSDKKEKSIKKEELFEFSKYQSMLNELADHKRELNTIKSLLNDKEITSWRQHTNFMNPSNDIIPYLKRYICYTACIINLLFI